MTEVELDQLPPLAIVVTSDGVAFQKGFTRWYLPGRQQPIDAADLAKRGGLTTIYKQEA